jgi:hypothetical protein
MFIEIRAKYIWKIWLVNQERWSMEGHDIFCDTKCEFAWRRTETLESPITGRKDNSN